MLAEPESMRARRWRRDRLQALAQGEPRKWYVSPVGPEPHENNPSIPDVLHHEPMLWGDLRGVAQLVKFSFEGGECTGVFNAIVDATPLGQSAWNRDDFACHLFFDDLVKSCFPLEIDGVEYPKHDEFLVRLLSQPPKNSADTQVRQAVLRELQQSETLRSELQKLYSTVYSLHKRLESRPVDEADTVTRKLELLQNVRDCINALAHGFESSNSVLARLRQAGQQMQQSEGFSRLLQFVDLERNLATVQVRLRLGADGHVHSLQLVEVNENHANPLLPRVWQRMWLRLIAFLGGHHYGQREIVASLFHEVFAPLVDFVVTCLALLGPIEFYLAALGFERFAASKGLDVCLPEIIDAPFVNETDVQCDTIPKNVATDTTSQNKDDDGTYGQRIVRGLFNPLLLMQGIVPVPADIPVEHHDSVVLLTGPNSGGKTRVLQALGIAQCLGQVGCFVPAKQARLVRAPTMFVSLVDELDPDQTEGRLGTELIRIRKLFDVLEPGSMALIDELCSGTNPTEGEEIAEMVISLLPTLHPQVFISSHFLGLVKRLEQQRKIRRLAFLEVQLDDDNKPTYRFVHGVAKTSLAGVLAKRLGVTREALEKAVLEKARKAASKP